MFVSEKIQNQNFRFRQIPNLFLCIIIGFLGALSLQSIYGEILKVELKASNILTTKIILACLFLFGFFFKKILSEKILFIFEISITFLLLLQMIFIGFLSSGLIQVDYIFHTDIFSFFAGIDVVATGILFSFLKQFRLWFFLMGGVLFTIYKILNPEIVFKPEIYLMPLIFCLFLELVLYSMYLKALQKNIVKKKLKTFSLNDSFFYIFLSLFIFHLIHYYIVESSPDKFILGAGAGLFLFNILYHYRIFLKKEKWKFIIARVLLVLSLLLSFHFSKFSTFAIFLFFIDTSIISFFRPREVKKPNLLSSILFGIIIAISVQYLNENQSKSILFFGIIFLITAGLFTPIFIERKHSILMSILFLIGTYFFSLFLYTPIPYDDKLSFREEEKLKPIPYLLLPFELDEEKFVFHNLSLPFKNTETLPKKNNFQNKTILLGIDERTEIILTYAESLKKNSLPFVLFSTNKKLQINLDLTKKTFPLFQIYFPKNLFPDSIFEENQFFKKEYLSEQEAVSNYSNIIKNLIQYSGGFNLDTYQNLNSKFFNSFKNYSEYYAKNEKFEESIYFANLAFMFKEKNEELESLIYSSILNITPETNQINIMEILIKRNQFKEKIGKRLFPLYLSLNEKEKAILIINDLIEYYNSIAGEEVVEEIKNLKVEKAKIFLSNSNISGAEEIIATEERKELNSVVWAKLRADLKMLKENTYRIYIPVDNNPRNEEP